MSRQARSVSKNWITSSAAWANLIVLGAGFQRTRGKPVGSHHRIGSFQSFSLGCAPLPKDLASYGVLVFWNFSNPQGVIGGRLLLVSFGAPDGRPALVRFQYPDRSCASKGLFCRAC